MTVQDEYWRVIFTNLMKMSPKTVLGWLDEQIDGLKLEMISKRMRESGSTVDLSWGYLSPLSVSLENNVKVWLGKEVTEDRDGWNIDKDDGAHEKTSGRGGEQEKRDDWWS